MALEFLPETHFDDTKKRNRFYHEVDSAYKLLYNALKQGGTVFACGNGGSAADTMHFIAELTGRYKKERVPLAGIALGSNPSEVTCIANDYGYENVFARPLRALGKRGDCLVGISTSGSSANVVEAWREAKRLGMTTIGLTGKRPVPVKLTVHVAVPSTITARIQEAHQRIYHHWCELLDQETWKRRA